MREVAERVEKHGLRTLWIFLVGGPGETRHTLEETLRFARWRLGRGGEPLGRPRVKFCSYEDLLAAANEDASIAS